jgi:hypothetical protein
MIGTDFLQLKTRDLGHLDYIIMNPPFSNCISHIKHAWSIAPDGCEIRALCNSDTLKLDRLPVRYLRSIIKENGGSITELGSCFTDAERKTLVEVALVTLKKPEAEVEDWESYFDYDENPEYHQAGLMTHDAVTEIIGRYVGALKMFEAVDTISDEINAMMGPINVGSIKFGGFNHEYNKHPVALDYDLFKTTLQKSAWTTVFNKMNMDKYMTEKLKDKINQFIEQQSELPFNARNIYNMLKFIHSTHGERMKEVLIEVFDKFTKHYDENRYNVEGWKTNSHYMINKKMILPYMVERRYSDASAMSMRYHGNAEMLDDLTKALCYLTGRNYDNFLSLHAWVDRMPITDPAHYWNDEDRKETYGKRFDTLTKQFDTKDAMKSHGWTREEWIRHQIQEDIDNQRDYTTRKFGVWHDWGFFEVKGFKKGTMHFKFKDDKVWELFNRAVADAKGFELPEHVAFI